MVRSAGGKRVTGRDMTKDLVKSHVSIQPARHASTQAVPARPKSGTPKRVRPAAKTRAKM